MIHGLLIVNINKKRKGETKGDKTRDKKIGGVKRSTLRVTEDYIMEGNKS